MKKKILLLVSLFALLACIFAVAVSAADPTSYAIEFRVMMDGDTSYTTVFAPNSDSGNPRISMANGFYKTATYDDETKKYTFADPVDTAEIVVIDFSEAVAHKSSSAVVKSVSSSTAVSFAKCKELKWFKAGSGALTEISDRLCLDWTALDTIDFGCATTTGDNTFQNTAFTTLTIPSTITKLKGSSFAKCLKLEELVIEGNVPTINASVFYGCTALKNVDLGSITTISKCMFQNCTSLESITLPSTVTTMAQEAFIGCSKLATVDMSASQIKSIEYATFSGTAISTIKLPNGIETIGKSAFNGLTTLTSVEMPTSVTTIGDSAFSSCSNLTNITLHEGIESIEQNAFRNSGITSVIIPSSVTSIGNYAFHSSKVTSVEFESRTSELSLGNVGVFQSCSSLTSITLTEGITAIGQDCFSGNKAEEIIVPDSVKTIGSGAFNSTVTKRIIISENSQLETMYAFSQAKAVESLYLPTGVKIIGSGFHYCYKLQRIDNFENVIMEIGSDKENTIPTNFFQECPLVEIKLPKTLGTISSGAFNGCKALQKIYIPSTVTSIDQNLFNSNLNNTVIFYCGTAEELLSITTDGNGATFIQNRIDAGSVVEYTTMDATYANGVIVENVNACDAFYAGIHKENDEITLVWLDKDGNAGEAFLSYLKVACPCGRGCGVETVIETLAPLFVDRGFAYGPNSMLQGVAVDRELLDEYGNYFTGIKYGLVAAAKSAQASASIIDANGVGANGYVAAVDYTERDYDLFEMNLYGISEDYQATEFYFGAYVIADGQVYYIHNGTTNNEAQAIAYDDVVMIVDALVPEKEEE